MQARITAAQEMSLQAADGLDGIVADDLDLKVDTGNSLERIHQKRAGATQAIGCLAGNHRAIGHDHGTRRCPGLLLAGASRGTRGRIVDIDARLGHDALQAIDLFVTHTGATNLLAAGKIAAHDLHAARIGARLVVGDGKAHHVDAHVGWTLIGAFAQDLLHKRTDHGECLDVAVVVNRGLAIGFQVERIDDVRIVEVGGCRLVCDVDGMRERQVPHREGLEFGIASLDAAQVLVVELRQAGSELARARTRGGNHHKGARRLHELVLAIALGRNNQVDIVGVALDGIVQLCGDAQLF